MTYQIIYSDRALETFDLIKSQINNRWGQKVVDDFEQRTLEVIDLVRVSPLIFQAVGNNTNLHRCVIHKNCSMFYDVGLDRITIHFFWDNRQEPLF